MNSRRPRATLKVVKHTRWHAVPDLRLASFRHSRSIGFVPPAPIPSASRPCFNPGRQPDWLCSSATPGYRRPTPNWLRSVISRCRRNPAPPASRSRPVLMAPAPRSSCASLLIQLELTRNWLRSSFPGCPCPLHAIGLICPAQIDIIVNLASNPRTEP